MSIAGCVIFSLLIFKIVYGQPLTVDPVTNSKITTSQGNKIIFPFTFLEDEFEKSVFQEEALEDEFEKNAFQEEVLGDEFEKNAFQEEVIEDAFEKNSFRKEPISQEGDFSKENTSSFINNLTNEIPITVKSTSLNITTSNMEMLGDEFEKDAFQEEVLGDEFEKNAFQEEVIEDAFEKNSFWEEPISQEGNFSKENTSSFIHNLTNEIPITVKSTSLNITTSNTTKNLPIPNKASNSTSPLPKLDSPLCDNPLYCTNVPNYPTLAVMSAVHQAAQNNQFILSFFSEEPSRSRRSTLSTPTEDRNLCETFTETIHPKAGRNSDNRWKFIINQERGLFVQSVMVKSCSRPGKECNGCHSDSSYRTFCKQEMADHKLLVLSQDQKRVEIDEISLPSGCACYKKYTVDLTVY